MKILLLTPYGTSLARTIRQSGDEVVEAGAEMCIMYGHRKILSPETIASFPRGVINIHNAFLPWNRGAHPNLWSWFDETPKGVTIHEVDAGIDTGPIIASSLVEFGSAATLLTSYLKLQQHAEELFDSTWKHIRNGKVIKFEQNRSDGSYHTKKDLEPIWPLLSRGWDTPTQEVVELGRHYRGQSISGMVSA
jgi:methionyl-tRNA formyltransferase